MPAGPSLSPGAFPERFTFFCRAALEFMLKSGKHPDIIHCHDWQTGIVPVLLYDIYKYLGMEAAENRVRRFHGGASAAPSTQNIEYAQRKLQQSPEKNRIAKLVAQHIPDHASLFINIGTTNEAIAKELLDHTGLKIITNNLHVAAIVSGKEDFDVIIAGGKVRSRDGGIIGEATMDFVSQFRTDFGIIGISGIDDDGSLLDFDYQEVRVAQALIKNSRQVLLACDHTKFGRHAMIKLGRLADVNVLVTDRAPEEHFVALLNEAEVTTLIADEDLDNN